MKIAMISTPHVAVPPRDYGGTELVVHVLAEGLLRRGHEVSLFATGDSRTAAELRFLYPQASWPPCTLSDLNHVSWAMAQIGEEGFDVVHLHSPCGLAVRRLLPEQPVVYTLHHAREDEVSRYYLHFGDVDFVAISADQAAREAPLPRMHVIHHGLDESQYRWRERPAEHVCFIGRFSPEKGPHTAIDAARVAEVPIRLAGEVQEFDRDFGERELAFRLQEAHVTLLGKVGMERKSELLRDSLALLMPIEWDEPFGLVIVEAMLSGCPVVAFRRGSAPELVEDGVTGYLVDTMAEMSDLIGRGGPLNGFDRRRCRERAVERFGQARMLSDYERLFERVVADARRPTDRLGAA